MKSIKSKVIGTLIATAFALGAAEAQARGDARDDAIEISDYLVATLVDIEDLATQLAQRAARRGNHHDAHALSNLADSASDLEQKVVRQIVYPLHDGKTFQYVKAQLSRLSSAFQLLTDDADEVHYLAYDLADLLEQVDYLKYDLAEILASGDRGRPDRDDGRPVIGR